MNIDEKLEELSNYLEQGIVIDETGGIFSKYALQLFEKELGGKKNVQNLITKTQKIVSSP